MGPGLQHRCWDVFFWCPHRRLPLKLGQVFSPSVLPQSADVSLQFHLTTVTGLVVVVFTALTVRFITRRFIGDYDPTLGR